MHIKDGIVVGELDQSVDVPLGQPTEAMSEPPDELGQATIQRLAGRGEQERTHHQLDTDEPEIAGGLDLFEPATLSGITAVQIAMTAGKRARPGAAQ